MADPDAVNAPAQLALGLPLFSLPANDRKRARPSRPPAPLMADQLALPISVTASPPPEDAPRQAARAIPDTAAAPIMRPDPAPTEADSSDALLPDIAAPNTAWPSAQSDTAAPPFAGWLLEQASLKRCDAVGELARAVRADPGFPKRGTLHDVRRRFATIGADGDVYEALDDAEREFARL